MIPGSGSASSWEWCEQP